MADISTIDVLGGLKNIKDAVARAIANAVTEAEEFDRQESIGAYEGRSIAAVFQTEIGEQNIWAWLQGRVRAGNFAGLRIGDYIDVQLTEGANVPAQTVRYRIYAIDPYYKAADQEKGHHLVMGPTSPVTVQGSKAVNGSYLPWRTTNDNNGTADEKHPYLLSTLHDWEINDFLPSLPSDVQAVIMTQRVLLNERYSSTTKLTDDSGWSWADLGKVWSPSEVEVYGFRAWSGPYCAGFDCQFPIFKQTKDRIMGNRLPWWLRSVDGSSSADACCCGSDGTADSYGPTVDWVRPRPCFLVG